MAVSKLRARTALAADIAMVNRQRFNEAVAEGFYPCAPPTVRGTARFFDVEDIVCLTIYGRLLGEGLVPRAAGSVVCELRPLLRRQPGIERVSHVVVSLQESFWIPSSELDPSADILSGGDIISIREWRLHYLRRRVIHRLEEENSVLGSED